MAYKHIEITHNKKAAKIILPKVLELINPKSVIDVGCGTGSFLSVLQDLNVHDILGVEGDWLDRDHLYVNPDIILIRDIQKPFTIERRFDLVINLEVAEHLKESSADKFVNTLVNLSDVILFSAAIPGQGGQNHINEQPTDYWVKKFEKYSYSFYDSLRMELWNEIDVDYWYKQNIFLVIINGYENNNLKRPSQIKDIIHPELFYMVLNQRNELNKKLLKLSWGAESPIIYFKLFIKSLLKFFRLKK